MPIIILLDENLLGDLLDEVKDKFPLEIHRGDFQTTKHQLSNMDKDKLYILLNASLKPHRYEIYCLAKKQEVSYVVVSPERLSTAKHDTPCLPTPHNILDHLRALKCSTAHKKKMVSSNYLSKVKKEINKVNKVSRECESRLLRMITLNPVPLEEVRELYLKMVEEEEI